MTGGHRNPPMPAVEMRDRTADVPLHEVECPRCGATIRARMADQDDATPQGQEV